MLPLPTVPSSCRTQPLTIIMLPLASPHPLATDILASIVYSSIRQHQKIIASNDSFGVLNKHAPCMRSILLALSNPLQIGICQLKEKC